MAKAAVPAKATATAAAPRLTHWGYSAKATATAAAPRLTHWGYSVKATAPMLQRQGYCANATAPMLPRRGYRAEATAPRLPRWGYSAEAVTNLQWSCHIIFGMKNIWIFALKFDLTFVYENSNCWSSGTVKGTKNPKGKDAHSPRNVYKVGKASLGRVLHTEPLRQFRLQHILRRIWQVQNCRTNYSPHNSQNQIRWELQEHLPPPSLTSFKCCSSG